MEPIIIKDGGVIMKLSLESLPTVNKTVNEIAANQFMKRLKMVLKQNPSVEVLDEFATIIQEKFPGKQKEHSQILSQAMKDIRLQS